MSSFHLTRRHASHPPQTEQPSRFYGFQFRETKRTISLRFETFPFGSVVARMERYRCQCRTVGRRGNAPKGGRSVENSNRSESSHASGEFSSLESKEIRSSRVHTSSTIPMAKSNFRRVSKSISGKDRRSSFIRTKFDRRNSFSHLSNFSLLQPIVVVDSELGLQSFDLVSANSHLHQSEVR